LSAAAIAAVLVSPLAVVLSMLPHCADAPVAAASALLETVLFNFCGYNCRPS
jgi:hypothetical protein